jgi:hypothetical protein
MRCLDALAWYICSEFANARGDMDGASFDAKAEAAALKLITREMQNEQLRSEWVIPQIPQATGATPYDTVNTIINTVKTRLNALGKLPADITITGSPYMQQCFNTAWRRMQEYLANKGYIKFTSEIELDNLAPKTSLDPAVQTSLDWNGYNNGTVLNTAIKLPQDLIMPVRVWQRVTGQNAMFSPMQEWIDGMPSIPATPYNQTWEWRGDAIYFTGANINLDLRIRYANYLPDFIETTTAAWYQQPVPIVRALDSLSFFVCAEIAGSRPDLELDTAAFIQQAEAAANLIYNRDVRRKQRVNVRRMSRSGRLEGSMGYGSGSGWGY